jgi:hypothetical protein
LIARYEIIDENGGGPGVWLAKRRDKKTLRIAATEKTRAAANDSGQANFPLYSPGCVNLSPIRRLESGLSTASSPVV